MKKLSTMYLILVLVGIAFNIHAKEAGDQYPNGAETFMAGALPPPGTYFINYAGYYSGTLHDGNGNEINAVKVGALFNTLRIVHVTDIKIFGGNYLVHALIPLINQNIEVAGNDNKKTGTGDITINPFAIAWHWPEFHMVSGLDINLPTGTYNQNTPFENIGQNYYTLEPLVAGTYINSDGWEISAKLMYSIHSENDDTKYQSGDEFHMDYGVNKHNGPWSYGIGGYYLKQLGNDKQNNVSVGKKGKVFAVGPQANYTHNGMQFIFKWQNESSVENRFGGDIVWFKFITRI